MSCGIYRIFNTVTQKSYVGQALNIEVRWKEHIRKLKSGVHENQRLQHAWNKYGSDVWRWEILLECSPEELTPMEQKFMDELKAHDRNLGYNICKIAGRPPEMEWTEERRMRMSSSIRKRYSVDPGLAKRMGEAVRANMTPELRAKIQVWVKNWWNTPAGLQHRLNSGERARKLWQDPEFRRKKSEQTSRLNRECVEQISEKFRAIWRDPELRERMLAAKRLRRHSEETKRRIGQSHLGKKRSAEGKKNMSEARRKKFETDPDFVKAHRERCQTEEARQISSKNFSKTWEKNREGVCRGMRDARRIKREKRIEELKQRLTGEDSEEQKKLRKTIIRLEWSNKRAIKDYEEKYNGK